MGVPLRALSPFPSPLPLPFPPPRARGGVCSAGGTRLPACRVADRVPCDPAAPPGGVKPGTAPADTPGAGCEPTCCRTEPALSRLCGGTFARQVAGWHKRCELARAFLSKYICKVAKVGPTSGPTKRLAHCSHPAGPHRTHMDRSQTPKPFCACGFLSRKCHLRCCRLLRRSAHRCSAPESRRSHCLRSHCPLRSTGCCRS